VNERDQKYMSLVAHLVELRKRLIVSVIAIAAGFAVAFGLYHLVVPFLTEPFLALQLKSPLSQPLFVNNVTEGFVVRVKIALIGGVILAFPVILYNAVRFVFPGLEKGERRTIAMTLAAAFLLAAGGFYYSYFQMIPLSLRFLTSAGFLPQHVGILLSFRGNISFVLQLLLVTLVLFQLPVLLIVLLRLGVVKRRTALKASRYVVVGAVVLSAILTPPDVVSQIALALPLIVLYFITLLVARVFRLGGEE